MSRHKKRTYRALICNQVDENAIERLAVVLAFTTLTREERTVHRDHASRILDALQMVLQ